MSALPEMVWWPNDTLPDALLALGGRPTAGLVAPTDTDEAVEAWLPVAAESSGIELQPIDLVYDEVEAVLRAGGPALVRVDGHTLVLLGGGRRVRLLARDRQRVHLPVARVAAALSAAREEPLRERADRLVACLPEARREACRRAVLASWLEREVLGAAWLVRRPPEDPLLAQLAALRVPAAAAGLVAAHLASYGLWIVSWWLVGQGAFQGRLDPGWMLAWALALVTLAPLRTLSVWLEGRVGVRVGTELKRRLLAGALRMDVDRVRTRGVGAFLGQIEEEAVLERFALGGGLAGALGTLELVVVFPVLAVGAGGTLHVALAVALLAAVAVTGGVLLTRRRRWTDDRVALTRDLVEKLIGHRTRMVQEDPARWHVDEDRALQGYTSVSARMDGAAVALASSTPVWRAIGALALLPGFVAGTSTPATLAIGIGGLLLFARSLEALAGGMADLAEARLAWEAVREVYRASKAAPLPPAPEVRGADTVGERVIDARGVTYGYPGAREPAVAAATLAIGPGDRILLTGPSGGGKSTFGALLLGNRRPAGGTLLLDGLDREVWGDAAWRERITGAPQFHENHVFVATLAFNLLMGHRWPARREDLRAADTVCRQLGLGPLLDRMPAGLHQLVGETGWRLSHGERSRVFLARALLKRRAELVVLDESFGALDAQAVEWCLYRANQHPGALLVIAHP